MLFIQRSQDEAKRNPGNKPTAYQAWKDCW